MFSSKLCEGFSCNESVKYHGKHHRDPNKLQLFLCRFLFVLLLWLCFQCIRFFGETSERKLAYKRTNPKVEMFGYTAQENSTEIFDINRPCDIKETFEFSLRGDDPVPTDEWQKMREELSRDFSLLYTRLILIIARGVYFNSNILPIPSGIISYNEGKNFTV